MANYLITGISRGIGRSLAGRLISEGHHVYGVARSASSAEDLGLAGIAELELTAFESYGPALAPLLASVPRLDGFVHCAGVVRPGSLTDARPADFTEQYEVNVVAAAELIRYWLPALRAAAGVIVLVNSGSGLNARPPLSAYGASKFALRGYAEALRQEEPGVRVCTLYPGRTATEMQRAVRAAEGGTYDEATYLRPDTVAGVIASVLSLTPEATITDLTLRPTALPCPSSPDLHRP